MDPDKFDFGGVLGRSFSTFARGAGPLLAMGAMIYSPLILVQGIFPDLLQPGPDSWAIVSFLDPALSLFLGSLLAAVVAVDVIERLRGGSVTIATSMRKGWSRIGPVLLVNFVVTLLTLVGMVLLVIPALVVAVLCVAAVQVCVIEGQGLKGSLLRSIQLTRGARWQILGILVLTGIAMILIYFPLSLLAVALIGLDDLAAISLFTSILQMIGGTYFAVLSSVLYYELRTKSEGVAPEELLEVFR